MFPFRSRKVSELPKISLYAEAKLPTEHGEFRVYVFRDDRDDKEHIVLTMGDLSGGRGLLVRVHSECLTGESLRSLRCDCHSQLEESMRMIAQAGRGIVIYLRQEGRGIGLGNKVRAYALQDRGLDTVEANHQLGFDADERDYHVAVSILKYFDVKSLLLITNNPEKIRDLKEHGIEIIQRVPIEIEPNDYSRQYLKTKRDKAGHLLNNIHLDDDCLKVVDLRIESAEDSSSGSKEK
jgi:3,4-dihydroxy 2-butanone 4-phosphate synthase/GTP cyclohydrolase II